RRGRLVRRRRLRVVRGGGGGGGGGAGLLVVVRVGQAELAVHELDVVLLEVRVLHVVVDALLARVHLLGCHDAVVQAAQHLLQLVNVPLVPRNAPLQLLQPVAVAARRALFLPPLAAARAAQRLQLRLGLVNLRRAPRRQPPSFPRAPLLRRRHRQHRVGAPRPRRQSRGPGKSTSSTSSPPRAAPKKPALGAVQSERLLQPPPPPHPRQCQERSVPA